MRLTVLGKSPAWQDAGGACSGYLLHSGETTVLLDCGNGVFGKLRQFVDYVDVHAVVLSHLHADHFLDLIPYAYALTYAPRQKPVPVPPWPGTDDPARPRLIAPPGAGKTFRHITSCFGDEQLLETAFELEEYESDSEPEVGPFRFSFHEVPHFTQTFAVKVTANGSTFVFGADSSPNSELVEFARDCDLLLVEATLPRPERTGIRGHLTPGEAGAHGKNAGAKRLVITHISDELDLVWARRQASEAFGKRVELAREGAVYEV